MTPDRAMTPTRKDIWAAIDRLERHWKCSQKKVSGKKRCAPR